MLLLVFRLDANVCGGHAVFPDFFGKQVPAIDLQTAEFGTEMFDVAAGIDERAERHVSTYA
jgi:hypothetical protein